MSYRVLLVCLANGVLIATPAFCQESDESKEEIDNIVVTASRSPIARTNLGSAVTVIDREEIALRQARYVTDLLRSVPGFAVSQVGTTGSQTQVRVRGAEANHVLVLIDGVRANDPASGDEFRWELLSTGNVERIEIVRGPQSSLWGSDAVAAVVHVITRSGSDGAFINAYAEGGSHDTVNGGISGGVGGERWSLDVGIENLDTDGTNISHNGSENDGSEMTTASLSSRLKPTEAFAIRLGLRAVDALSQFDPIDFFGTGLPEDGDAVTDAERIYANIGATLRGNDSRFAHHLDARYLNTDNKNLSGGLLESSTSSDRRTLGYQTDFQIAETLLSLAVEHERTRFVQRGQIGFGDPNQDQDMNVLSYIVDVQGRTLERLTWLISARYDDNSDFDGALSGRLSLVWLVSDATRLRANLGTGRKAPTFIERFGFFPDQFIGNPDLRPEASMSIDVGVDRKLFDDALEISMAVFYQDLKDEINGFVFDPATFLFTAENSDGDSNRKGVELSATLELSQTLSFGGSYTYTDSKGIDAAGSEFREFRRPRHNGNFYGNFRTADGRLNLQVIADYGGESTDEFFPPFPLPSQVVTLESYWLLGLTVSYGVNRNASIFLRGENLMDEDYEQVFGYRTPGRSAYAGVRLSFGR